MSDDGYDIGGIDECGRCGRFRADGGAMAKDVTVHSSTMPVGNWYLCEHCQNLLNKFLRGEGHD